MNSNACPITAFTLFCEDLRQEVGGKLSAMGIYQRVMVLPTEQALLPKLVAWTMLEMQNSAAISTVRVQLWDRERLLSDAELNLPLPEPGSAEGEELGMGRTMVNIPLEVVPFQAQAGMVLRLVCTADDFNYESDALHIIRAA